MPAGTTLTCLSPESLCNVNVYDAYHLWFICQQNANIANRERLQLIPSGDRD